ITQAAMRTPQQEALTYGPGRLNYAGLAHAVGLAANCFLASGLGRGDRVAVYLEKRIEAVVAMFSATAAGGVFVPVNPLLKPPQVGFILNDCHAGILVTSSDRLQLLQSVLPACPDLHTVVVVGKAEPADLAGPPGVRILPWDQA